MKIVHVTDTSIYNFDGISTYVNELLEVSAQKGDETMVLTTTPHGTHLRGDAGKCRAEIHVFPCFRFPGKPKFVTVRVRGARRIIDTFNPDLVWIHTIGTLAAGVARQVSGKYKVVYTKHCFDGELWCGYLNIPRPFQRMVHWSAQAMENRILRAATGVAYHLNDVAKVEHGRFYPKFMSIPPPLNSRFFENPADRSARDLSKKITLGFCGRCDPDKGIANTFKGLEIFQRKYPGVDFEFMLIGDGPEAHLLKKKYPDMKVTITGYVNDVIPFLDQLDGFILSSLHETISLSSLEAYARGIPVFSVPIGYLSGKPAPLAGFHLFETPEQLAGLLHAKLVMGENHARSGAKNPINDFVISYCGLYSMVVQSMGGAKWDRPAARVEKAGQ